MMIQEHVQPNSLFTFTVDNDNASQRIDQYITSRFACYSRSFFQTLIQEKGVLRNDILITKPSTPVSVNDIITVTFPPERVIEQQAVSEHTNDVAILDATQHFMIIYKPAHLLVHPPSHTSSAITLTHWIKQYHQDIAHVGIVDRPGIVHRLDKDTSGIMIITRTNHAHSVFNTLFKDRKINKTYLALVEGHPEKEGTINLAIGRNPFNRIKMATFDQENHEELCKKHSIKIRHALTEYKVLRYFSDASLVEIKPTTGRTHQIRVHMAAIGHPVIGDQTYGKASPLIARQALHAHSLSFTFDNIDYSFSKDMPTDMQQLIDKIF